MNEETPRETPPPTTEECALAAQLPAEDLRLIDETIVGCAQPGWHKVARVMWEVEAKLGARFPGLTHRFYTLRLGQLVRAGRLESQGHLMYMRFSEIRRPAVD